MVPSSAKQSFRTTRVEDRGLFRVHVCPKGHHEVGVAVVFSTKGGHLRVGNRLLRSRRATRGDWTVAEAYRDTRLALVPVGCAWDGARVTSNTP